ncbi:hypothetical protein pb186bvf_018077, partial [Paramecium bursaria]
NDQFFGRTNLQDKIKKYLVIPSGQKLKDYQIFNINTLQYFQFIQNIKIVSLQNEKLYQISEKFTINSFILHKGNNSFEENLTKYQNKYTFYQTENQSDLNEFKLSYNPDLDDIILLQITPTNQINYTGLQIFAKMQKCQIGEIKFQNQCLKCDPRFNLYSLRQNSNYCSLFDLEIGSDFKSGSIKLRQGYWRPYVYSHKIERCQQNQKECMGGWFTGDNSCQIGYLGGICQSCDTQNVRGDGYFKRRDNKCMICTEFNYLHFILQFSIIIMIYIFQLYMKNENNLLLYKRFILMKLVNYRVFCVLQVYLIGKFYLTNRYSHTIITNYTIKFCFIIYCILKHQLSNTRYYDSVYKPLLLNLEFKNMLLKNDKYLPKLF